MVKNVHEIGIEEVANRAVHPIMKENITNYKKLINYPVTRKMWLEAMAKELGHLVQGYKNTKEQAPLNLWTMMKYSKNTKGKGSHICVHCCWFLPTEGGPQPGPYHCRGGFDKLSFWTYHPNSRHNNNENNVELSNIHNGSKVHPSDANNFYLATICKSMPA